MVALKDIVCSEKNRPQIVRDAAQLVESEVRGKSGISGMAIKTGYKAVKKIKPGLIEEVIEGLLPEFVANLEPLFGQWESAGRQPSFEQFLSARKSEAANALLGVTDGRAERTRHNALRKTYKALRPHGQKNVESALPGLGRLLQRYLD